jgi:opacity protein-like surface antigen
MKSLTLVAAGLASLATVALAPAARADGYVAVGVGTGGSSGSSDGFVGGSRMSGRLMIGQRISLISLEAGVSGYGLDGMVPNTSYDAVALGAGLKLNLPLFLGLEIFGRGGVERTWLEASERGMSDYSGNGYVAGAGLEYGFDLVVTEASVWLDWTRHGADLHGDDGDREARADLWTAGLSLDI